MSGAQVVGRIRSFGFIPAGKLTRHSKNKPVDYRSGGEGGTILAMIDDSVISPNEISSGWRSNGPRRTWFSLKRLLRVMRSGNVK